MFKKSGPPAGIDSLADRVRRLAERKPQGKVEQPVRLKSQERAPRQPLYRQGTLILEGGHKIVVAIKNLSASGARVETRERMALSAEVLLTEVTMNLRRRARVVWQEDGMAGLQFIER